MLHVQSPVHTIEVLSPGNRRFMSHVRIGGGDWSCSNIHNFCCWQVELGESLQSAHTREVYMFPGSSNKCCWWRQIVQRSRQKGLPERDSERLLDFQIQSSQSQHVTIARLTRQPLAVIIANVRVCRKLLTTVWETKIYILPA